VIATAVPRDVVQSDPAGLVRHRPDADVGELTQAGATAAPTLWWLGQAGFALRHAGGTLLVDPYLSDTLAEKYAGTTFPHVRLHEPPVEAAALRGIGLVLHTHAHTDHLDPGTVSAVLAENRPEFVAPRARREVALQRHVPADRLHAVSDGESLTVGGAAVHVVPAAHEKLETDELGDHVFLGYVVEVGGVRVYHSGDCAPYAGQADLLRELDIDVALLPVNGRDEHRLSHGVPGNFTVDEAVALCREAGIPALVCHHFGLFDFNTVDPGGLATRLAEIAGDLEWTVPAVGSAYQLRTERRST
jgi:L-ascorbate metabolism protein UlaG (beta-lactamase superfamily)